MPKGKINRLINFSMNLYVALRSHTRNISRGLPKLDINPIVTYDNAETNKKLIYKENINKSFVYRWTNKINGKTYLGSTSNAKSRLQTYYDQYSLNITNMPIYKAILKYGHSNFIFDIIEYCEPQDIIQREQYYLDHFDFDYNILEKANSSLGYKHTSKTIEKLKGRKNLLGYKHTEETLAILRESQINKTHSVENKQKMREIWAERKLNSDSKNTLLTSNLAETCKGSLSVVNNAEKERKKIKGKIVVVTNIDNNLFTEYLSISEAALALNITRATLRTYIKNKTVFNIFKQDPSVKKNGVLKEKFLITFKEG